MAYSTIIFDFGGVLLDWSPDYLYRKLIPDAEERRTFLTEVTAQSWNEEMDAGKPWAQGIAERQAIFPDQADLIAAFHDRWIEMIAGPINGMHALHARLRKAGVPLYGLTNFASETLELATKHYPILGDFDGVVVSAHEGVNKPDAKIYQILLDRYNLRAEDCIFIDDRADNIEAARKLGMGGIVFADAQSCMDQLADMMPDLSRKVVYGDDAASAA